MATKYTDDSLALHTDLYQINMVESYWEDGIQDKKAVFEIYFRKLPFKNGYAIFAGLEKIVSYLEISVFQIVILTIYKQNWDMIREFLGLFKKLRFTGNLRCMKEGEFVFANEPILRVEASLRRSTAY